jgi:Flp pilus assembly protein TadG
MRRSERGAVTAELAVALPVLLSVTVGLVWLLAVGAAQLRVVDGAREAARALARGDPEAAAVSRAVRVAGEGSTVRTSSGSGVVTVTVRRRLAGPDGAWDFLPGVTLHARAVAALERTGSTEVVP